MPTDYAMTAHARKERYTKASRIASAAWDLGMTPEHILHGPDDLWAALCRRVTGRTASDETRRLTYCHLALKEEWCAGHPDEPGSRRTVRDLPEITADLTARRPPA